MPFMAGLHRYVAPAKEVAASAESEMSERDKMKAAVAAVEAEAIKAYKLKLEAAKHAEQPSQAAVETSAKNDVEDWASKVEEAKVRCDNTPAHKLRVCR